MTDNGVVLILCALIRNYDRQPNTLGDKEIYACVRQAKIAAKLLENPCDHVFAANYAMNDSHHPYCTKCGIAK